MVVHVVGVNKFFRYFFCCYYYIILFIYSVFHLFMFPILCFYMVFFSFIYCIYILSFFFYGILSYFCNRQQLLLQLKAVLFIYLPYWSVFFITLIFIYLAVSCQVTCIFIAMVSYYDCSGHIQSIHKCVVYIQNKEVICCSDFLFCKNFHNIQRDAYGAYVCLK